jgi:hypothetical protein
MKELMIVVAGVMMTLVVSYHMSENRKVYRECLATQERIAKSNDRFSVIGCYR